MKLRLRWVPVALALTIAAGAGCRRQASTPRGSQEAAASPTPALQAEVAQARLDFAVDIVETREGKALWYDVPEASLAARRAWPGEMTAASDKLPQNTYVRVTRLDPDPDSNPGRKGGLAPVVVRITDHGVGRGDALVEVDRDAAKALGMVKDGTVRVRVDVLSLKNATVARPASKTGEDTPGPKASELTGKPAADAGAEKQAAARKTGEKVDK